MKTVTLKLRVQPRARRSEWGETLADGTRKVRIAAPPEKGRANQELIRFLAEYYGVSRQAVEIRAGTASHAKQVRVRLEG